MLSVSVGGPCLNLLGLSGAYGTLSVMANLVYVWDMGLTTGCKVDNNITSI